MKDFSHSIYCPDTVAHHLWDAGNKVYKIAFPKLHGSADEHVYLRKKKRHMGFKKKSGHRI
jgi:hypothetical protein